MVTIHHFVNLVVWEEINLIMNDSNTNTIKHVLYCDSWSMFFAIRLFGNMVKRRAGTQFLLSLLGSLDSSFLVLSSGKKALKTSANILDLPEDITPENFLLGKIGDNISSVIIGISSPKQNTLAIKIAMENPNIKDIYCLGGAVDLILSYGAIKRASLLRFMLTYPRRTYQKVLKTINSMIFLLFLSDAKKKFSKFICRKDWN